MFRQISRVDDERDTLSNLSGTSTSFTYVPKRAPTYSLNPKGCLRATRTLPEERGIQRTSYPFLCGGPFGLQLRAAFSPVHPLARRDVPLARARAFCFLLCNITPSRLRDSPDCPSLRASDEHIFIVRVLRARRAPDRSRSTLPGRAFNDTNDPTELAHFSLKSVAWIGPQLRTSNDHNNIMVPPSSLASRS